MHSSMIHWFVLDQLGVALCVCVCVCVLCVCVCVVCVCVWYVCVCVVCVCVCVCDILPCHSEPTIDNAHVICPAIRFTLFSLNRLSSTMAMKK